MVSQKRKEKFEPENGAVAFVEIYSEDLLASRKFLENVFGWKMTKIRAGGLDIWIFKGGNGPECHLIKPAGLKPGTVAFVRVKSVDEAARKAIRFGGRVLVPKFEVPGLGWFTY